MISYLHFDSKNNFLEYKASNSFGEPVKIRLDDNILSNLFLDFCKEFNKTHLDLVESLRTPKGKSY
jgi:hypothetical protein